MTSITVATHQVSDLSTESGVACWIHKEAHILFHNHKCLFIWVWLCKLVECKNNAWQWN